MSHALRCAPHWRRISFYIAVPMGAMWPLTFGKWICYSLFYFSGADYISYPIALILNGILWISLPCILVLSLLAFAQTPRKRSARLTMMACCSILLAPWSWSQMHLRERWQEPFCLGVKCAMERQAPLTTWLRWSESYLVKTGTNASSVLPAAEVPGFAQRVFKGGYVQVFIPQRNFGLSDKRYLAFCWHGMLFSWRVDICPGSQHPAYYGYYTVMITKGISISISQSE